MWLFKSKAVVTTLGFAIIAMAWLHGFSTGTDFTKPARSRVVAPSVTEVGGGSSNF